ncbi:UNVERIFIED_CONTAM: hypothetical protein PYX00_008125 [Menopon gallinae]|uniref:Angiotensin-converting enzyme n=1 Tax=Menopon gallinae TaxID=328185 RepID=A0AAW2HM25_9NEOP
MGNIRMSVEFFVLFLLYNKVYCEADPKSQLNPPGYQGQYDQGQYNQGQYGQGQQNQYYNQNPYYGNNNYQPVTTNYPNQYNGNPNYPSSTTNYNYNQNNPSTERYNTNSRYDPTSNQYYTPTNRYDPQYPDRGGRNYQNNQGAYYPPVNQEPVNYIPPQEIQSLLARLDQLGSEQCSLNVYAQWDYETNVNDATQLNALAAQQQFAYYQKEVHDLIKQIEYRRVPDPRLWRQLRYLSVVGSAALSPEQYDRYNRLVSEMVAVYDQAAICAYNEPFRCGLRLNPDLNLIMARSRDWDELQHTWVEWRRHTGQYVRDLYDQLVDVTNEAARLNNFSTAADMWNFPYESPTFQQDVEDIWTQVSPLFEHLHAYVRRKLRDLYGPERISRRAPLPSHILGNMWAQSWVNILDITIPYPGKNFLDVTPNMVDQGYTPLTMLQLAEEFFLSLNMSAMPPEFFGARGDCNEHSRQDHQLSGVCVGLLQRSRLQAENVRGSEHEGFYLNAPRDGSHTVFPPVPAATESLQGRR